MSVPGSAAAAAAAADPAETERLKAKQTALGKQVAFLRTQLLQRAQELDKMKLSLRDTQNQLQQQQQQTTQGALGGCLHLRQLGETVEPMFTFALAFPLLTFFRLSSRPL